MSPMDSLVRDVRYGLRMLRKTPGFTAIALLTLAIGIGVNTAVFSVVNGLLIRPLPFPDPDRLGTVSTLFKSPRGQAEQTSVTGKTFLAIHDAAKTVSTAVAGGGFGRGVNLVAGGAAANVSQRRVSAGYFAVLGVAPFIGREFTPDEDREGGPPVAVLSHDLWSRVFNGDPAIVGRSIMLRGEPYTVVGVMPASFASGSTIPTDVWTPVHPSTTGEGGGSNYGMIARLRPGVTWAQASAEIGQLGSEAAHAGYKDDVTALSTLVPLQQTETSEIRQPLLMLWGAVGMVLLIACVNLAGLLLARSALRAREIATRMALGGGRAAVVRQLLVESTLLALGGGVLGVAVGAAVLSALMRLNTDVFAIAYPVNMDAGVLAATLTIALATSVIFGLVPALHSSRVNVQATLAESGTRAIAGRAGRWPRRVLIVAEVAMGVVLLVSAGLLVRTFVHLRSLNPGFDPSSVVTATVSLQDARYRDPAKVDRLFSDTLLRIRQIPGVQAAGVTLGLPYTRLLNLGFKPLDAGSSVQGSAITNLSYVTPGYIEALRIPVRAGRSISDSDAATAPGVAIVNEEFVRRYYKGQEILGRRIAVAGSEREIVGLVGNARTTSPGFQGYREPLVTPPIVYVPASQTNQGFLTLVHTWFQPSWVVRAAGSADAGRTFRSAEDVSRGIREAVAAVDPLLPIAKLETMSDVQAASLASQRFMMTLVVGLGVVALLLAAIGIHGLIASSVTERTRELGIRLALGATGAQVVREMVVPGIALAGAGVAVGSVAALAVVRLMQSFLWGVTPTDPLTFLAVIGTLLAVALLASFIPALRVLRLDPAMTLRAE